MMTGLFILVLSSLLATSFSWSITQNRRSQDDLSLMSRRSFFHHTATIAVATSTSYPTIASAAITYTKDQEKALKQWTDSIQTIDNLLDNWDTTGKEDGISGDAIRKELGTANFGKDVSPLFQIDKAFKVLRENDDIDLVEFTELSEEFAEVLASADSMAYSANFAGGSGNPKDNNSRAFTDKARVEVKRLQQITKSISALL